MSVRPSSRTSPSTGRPQPVFVDGIDITRTFSPEEIFDLHAKGRLRKIALAGYCTRAGDDGIQFIPWYESTRFRMDTDTLPVHASDDFVPYMQNKLETEHPMRRSTPQQKVGRMMLRLMAEVKRTGTIPGFTPEDIKHIVGESWKQGEPLAAEDVQKVAAYFLGLGQKQNKEADSHRVTRAHALA